MLTTRAPAKINLSLHVLGRRADGYHDLESLVAFAGSGDILTLDEGEPLGLTIEGPTAAAAGGGPDNLVLKAARALAERVSDLRLGHFTLVKRLPVAAGIGGGSSDAAAALRLLAQSNGLAPTDPRLLAAAVATGADVPVCLDLKARVMRGIGERLDQPLDLPPLVAVLVNPGIKVETRDVFGRMGLKPGDTSILPAHPDFGTGADLLTSLRRARNDMEDAASTIAPVIGDVLAVLSAARGCRLARMSGSGATCFGLFETCRAAGQAFKVIRRDHPGWWVKSTVLR